MSDKNPVSGCGAPLSAAELLDMYYLDLRSALLEAAAGLDRIQQAQGGEEAMKDPRVAALRQAGDIVGSEAPGRAERFQHLLSEA
jgi:hypothetical protein